MKTLKNEVRITVAAARQVVKKNGMRLSLLAVVITGCLMPFGAKAATERFVLDFCDSHVKGQRGEVTTLLLKKTLKAQYPWVDLGNVDLRKVVLIAKSKIGRGGAQLRIGKRWSQSYQVSGRPESFRDSQRYTFDRVNFRLPSSNDHGPWQIDLKGNFIVRKVILVIDDRSQGNNNRRFFFRHH